MEPQARGLPELIELHETTEGEFGERQHHRLLRLPRGRTAATLRMVPFVAGFLLLAVAGLAAAGHTASGLLARVDNQPSLVKLNEEDDPCFGHPFLRLEKQLVNNLGGHGPQVDSPEGLIYRAIAENSGLNGSRTVELHVHAVSETEFVHSVSEGVDLPDNYQAAWPKANGISGNFATVNIKPGLNVTLKVHVYDPLQKKILRVPSTAITFFDLDTGDIGPDGVAASREYVKIKGYKHFYTTNTTEIKAKPDGKDGASVFEASQKGTGEDNPENPLELTVKQKNRVVSFEFEEKQELIFELGCTPGKTARVFKFVLRPALRCAWTLLPGDMLMPSNDPNSPVNVVQGSAGALALPVGAWALCALLLASQSRS